MTELIVRYMVFRFPAIDELFLLIVSARIDRQPKEVLTNLFDDFYMNLSLLLLISI